MGLRGRDHWFQSQEPDGSKDRREQLVLESGTSRSQSRKPVGFRVGDQMVLKLGGTIMSLESWTSGSKSQGSGEEFCCETQQMQFA